jgi:hypothetical protein
MSNAETYIKHQQLCYYVRGEKKLDVKLKKTTDAVKAAWGEVKKLRRVPKKKPTKAKAEWELEVTTAKCKA